MGYQEKRTWIVLALEAMFYGTYFWVLHHGGVHLGITLHLILAMIIAQVVLHSVLALTTSPARRDERDVTIENRAFRAGYFALSIAVVCVIAAVAHHLAGPVPHAYFIINVLLLVLGVAQITKLVTQVTLYRKFA